MTHLLGQSEPRAYHCTCQVLERDPSSLQPHFGTAAVAEAVQPLHTWLAERGLAGSGSLGSWSATDVAAVRRAAGTTLESGMQAIEVSCNLRVALLLLATCPSQILSLQCRCHARS